jgi:ParB family chromosome partitioning protein
MTTGSKSRLGRGLDALIGGASERSSTTAPAPEPVAQVPLTQIDSNPYQPRKSFDEKEIETLKESLQTHGLLQPIVVRHTEQGYQLIAGERRLRAARAAGWKDIPVRIVDLNDQQVFEAAMVENLQRSDLNPIEKAIGFQEYLKAYKVTHEELAQKIGLERSTITNLVRLLELAPDVQDAVRLGQISTGHAKALLSLEDPAQQSSICKEIIAKGHSVRAVESLVKQQKPETPAAESPPEAPVKKTSHVQAIEDELRQKLATRVEIRLRSGDKGQIILGFDSNDDFERVLEVLRK